MESYFSRSCKDSSVSLRRGPTVTASTSGDLTIYEQMFLSKLGGANNAPTMKTEEKVSQWLEQNEQESIELEYNSDERFEDDNKF